MNDRLPLRVEDIIADVCQSSRLSRQELLGRTRTIALSYARFECWDRCRALGFTTTQIGRWFDRDHSTIVEGLRRFREMEQAA